MNERIDYWKMSDILKSVKNMTCSFEGNANDLWEKTKEGESKPVLVDISDQNWLDSLSMLQLMALYSSVSMTLKLRCNKEETSNE